MNNRIVTVLEIETNDEVIGQLKSIDEELDNVLIDTIQAYKTVLKQDGIEIFYVGNHFLVCENCTYFAVYEDELEKS